jgi:hypothetical protein
MTDAEFGAKVLKVIYEDLPNTQVFGVSDALRASARESLGKTLRELFRQAVRDVLNEPVIQDHAVDPKMSARMDRMERDR